MDAQTFRKIVFTYIVTAVISSFVCSWLFLQGLHLPAFLFGASITCVLFYLVRPAVLQQRFKSLFPQKEISKLNLLIIYVVPPVMVSVLLLFCVKKKYQPKRVVPVFQQRRFGINIALALMLIGMFQNTSPWLHFPVQSYATEFGRNTLSFGGLLEKEPEVRYSPQWKKLFRVKKFSSSVFMEKKLERNPAQKNSDKYAKKLVSGLLSFLEENSEPFDIFAFSPLQWMTPSSLLQISSIVWIEKAHDSKMRDVSIKKLDSILKELKRDSSKVDADIQELDQRLEVQRSQTHQEI